MVGTKLSGRLGGNPDIAQISKEKSTGPRTELGKLKVSLNAAKYSGTGSEMDLKKPSQVNKMMLEAGVDFSKADKAIKQRNLFEIWLKSLSINELTEIQHLERMIDLLNTDMSMRVMRKLEKGIPLGESDIKLIRLLKECITTSHELKFGRKNVNLHASYEDIRKMMFGEKDVNPRSK